MSLAVLLKRSFFQLIPHAVAFLLGTLGIAALLPYVPGKSFAVKGVLLGALWALFVIRYAAVFSYPDSQLVVWGHGLIAATIRFGVGKASCYESGQGYW